MKMPNRAALVSSILVLSVAAGLLAIFFPFGAQSATYIDVTAHGSSTYGVDRATWSIDYDPPFTYAKGLCIHCHETHASVKGAEPLPNDPAGPDNYELFYTNYNSGDDLDNFCLKCHTTSVDTLQSTSPNTLTNRTYSYRAGGHSAGFDGSITNIRDMLDFPATSASSHDMSRIQDFIVSKGWNYTSDSNPCIACHNPHRAQGDPANSPNGTKNSASRGWPLSRPSEHVTTLMSWNMWGDVATERMGGASGAYTGQKYFDPYRSGLTNYEPDNAASQQYGANLTDFVTFCTECHNTSDSLTSDELPSPLRQIDWSSAGDKHGDKAFDGAKAMRAPYSSATLSSSNLVTSCSDCHEPHGAGNKTLIRGGVNGVTLANQIQLNPLNPAGQCGTPSAGSPYSDKEMAALCITCHMDDNALNGACGPNTYYYIHHDSNASPAYPATGDAPYTFDGGANGTCTNCHNSSDSAQSCTGVSDPINCTCCHYHGSSAAGRTTF